MTLAALPESRTANCLACDKLESHPVTSKGWRLAASRIGGYVCSSACDQVILEYDEKQKELKKQSKKKSKGKSLSPTGGDDLVP